MSQDTTVAARYARALFLVTERRRETESALADMLGLRPVIARGTRVGDFLASPGMRLSDKRDGLKSALRGRVQPTVAVFLDLLLRKKRLGEFPRIAVEFEALVERRLGIQRAEVVSAVPLSSDEMSRLHSTLERTTGSKIRLSSSLEPRLLGGALVRIGDRVIDRTVRTLLQRIGEQLSEVSV